MLQLLQQHAALAAVPPSELAWLASHIPISGTIPAGVHIVERTDEATEMVIVIRGRIVVYFQHGSGRRHLMESRPGSITGLLPFSRLKGPLGDVIAEEPTDAIVLHRDQFPGLIRECPVITGTLVHIMLDRARRFSVIDWQDEKIMSLGRLAAGLTHELNNPASAALRNARALEEALRDVTEAALALGESSPELELTAVRDLAWRQPDESSAAQLSPLDRVDLEESVASWLRAHGIADAPAFALAADGVSIAQLEALARHVPARGLEEAVRYVAAVRGAVSLVRELAHATHRVHNLVSSVNRFTHVDRSAAALAADVTAGLADTVTVLSPKAQAKSVHVSLQVDNALPPVTMMVAELNQAWANLLENAIDAVPAGGSVVVRASATSEAVIVRFIDDGPGIPPDVQARMFDPFYTTKRIGEGTGLGLDLVRRVVRGHEGQIDVETAPGRTEFRVRLPLTTAGPRFGSAQPESA
ncbi:MAG: ATP-binding protein [Gemmatimonadaceae bacterium]